ncbi:MAG: hypothetical protein AAFM92_03240 [Pseudomonadota bacterium]
MDIAKLGVEVDTRPAARATQDLSGFEKQAARAEKSARNLAGGVDGMGRQANNSSRAFNGLATPLRQTSLQLSQVAQQTQASGNFLQALAIQLPDIGLAFGTIGIAAGVAAGAILPVIGNLRGVQDELGDIRGEARSAFDAVVEATDAARQAQERYDAAVMLGAQGRLQASGQTLQALSREARALDALARLEDARLQNQRRALQDSIAELRDDLDREIASATSNVISDPNDAFARSRAEDAILQTTLDILAARSDDVDLLREQQAELDLVNALLDDGRDEALAIVEELIKANNEAAELSSWDFGAGQLSIAALQAGALAQNLAIARGQQRDQSVGGNVDFFDPRNEAGVSGQIFRDRGVPEEIANPSVNTSARRRRSGGGAAQADRERNRLLQERDRILEGLKSEQDRFNDSVAQADRLLKAGVLTQADYNRQIAQLERELADVQFAELHRGIDDISRTLGDALVDFDNFGDSVRNILRQLASDIFTSGIREALLSSFNVPGPSGGFGGGSGLGALFGNLFGGFRANGGPVTAGRDYIVGERGPELFTPTSSGFITPNHAMSGAGGRLHVSVSVDGDGALKAMVRDQAGRVVAESTPSIVRESVGQVDRALRSTRSFGNL